MDKDEYLIDLSGSTKSDFGKKDFSEQSYPQKVFSAVVQFETDMLNGGLLQYFTNCWGDPSLTFSRAALQAIGAEKFTSILDRAFMLLPPDIPDDFEARSLFLESQEDLSDSLSKLDDEFYSHPGVLTERLFAFVASHPSEFGPTPKL